MFSTASLALLFMLLSVVRSPAPVFVRPSSGGSGSSFASGDWAALTNQNEVWSLHRLLLRKNASYAPHIIGTTNIYDPGHGDYYGVGEYVRDGLWPRKADPDYFSAEQIAAFIFMHGIHTNHGNGAIIDGYGAPGPEVWSFDTQYDFIDALYLHYLKTGHPNEFIRWRQVASNAVANVTVVSNLTYVANSNANKGFGDAFGQQGFDLVTTGFRYQANQQLWLMNLAIGDVAVANAFSNSLALISNSLSAFLWDANTNLFRLSSGTATGHAYTNHSPVGSGFIARLGACDSNKTFLISRELAGLGLNSRGCYTYKGIPFLQPTNEMTTLDYGSGYQKGGAWPGLCHWVWDTVALHYPREAENMISEAFTATSGGLPLTTFERIDMYPTPVGANEYYLWSISGPLMSRAASGIDYQNFAWRTNALPTVRQPYFVANGDNTNQVIVLGAGEAAANGLYNIKLPQVGEFPVFTNRAGTHGIEFNYDEVYWQLTNAVGAIRYATGDDNLFGLWSEITGAAPGPTLDYTTNYLEFFHVFTRSDLSLFATNGLTANVITNNGIVWLVTNNTPSTALPNGSLASVTDGRLFVRSNSTWVLK